MIRKLVIFILCLTLSSCIGFNSATGLKFKNESETIKLKNGTFVNFEKPIGNCGVKVIFFGIILPIIPIWYNSNICEKSFDVAFNAIINNPKLESEINIKIKYNNIVYNPVAIEKLFDFNYVLRVESKLQFGRKFKFKIDDFKNFKEAEDKAIIISGKIDGKKFTEELPVKWGLMLYKNPSIPW
jgi:hypothetical protein